MYIRSSCFLFALIYRQIHNTVNYISFVSLWFAVIMSLIVALASCSEPSRTAPSRQHHSSSACSLGACWLFELWIAWSAGVWDSAVPIVVHCATPALRSPVTFGRLGVLFLNTSGLNTGVCTMSWLLLVMRPAVYAKSSSRVLQVSTVQVRPIRNR